MRQHLTKSIALSVLLPACSAAPALVPSRPVALPPVAETAAPPPKEPSYIGDPVLVPQRVFGFATTSLLSPTGTVALLRTGRALQIVDVETGLVRGERVGCFQRFGFARGGHTVAAVGCETNPSMTLWDLDSDHDTKLKLGRRQIYRYVRPNDHIVLRGPGGVDVVDSTTGERMSLDANWNGETSIAVPSAAGPVVLTDGITVRVIGLNGALLTTAPPGKGHVSAIDITRNADRIVVSDSDGVRIIDVRKGRVTAEARPCKTNLYGDVEWNDPGTHVAVSCNPDGQEPGRVVTIAAAGGEVKEIAQAYGRHYTLVPRGDRLGLAASDWGGRVVEASTGETIWEAAGPSSIPPSFSEDLERLLVGTQDLASLRIIGRAPAFDLHVEPTAAAFTIHEDESPLLAIHRAGPAEHFDPELGKLVGGTAFSPDGARAVRVSADGSFELVERASNAVTHVAAVGPAISPQHFSPGGKYLIGTSSPARPNGTFDGLVHVLDAKTGKLVRSISTDLPASSTRISRDDAVLAVVTGAPGVRCGTPLLPTCFVAKTYDLATGKRLAVIKLSDETQGEISDLSADGARMAIDGEVLSTRGGRRVGKSTADHSVRENMHFLLDGRVVKQTSSGLDVEDAAGKLLEHVPDAQWQTRSPNGRWVLIRSKTLALWDASTKAPSRAVATPPSALDKATLVLSNDGRFLFAAQDGRLATIRLDDGATLYREGAALDAPCLEPFAFDPSDLEHVHFAVRRGPSIDKSPIERLTAASPGAHPGLFADFMAGKPLTSSPK